MLSTTVSICGKVLRTWSGLRPRSKAVYFFGSKVSVWAMPPAIHNTITVSAVGLIFSSGSAVSWRGKPAAKAESVVALAVFIKSRRFHWLHVFIRNLVNHVKFGEHGHCREQVFK